MAGRKGVSFLKRWLLILMFAIFAVTFVIDLVVRDPAQAHFWWEKIYGFDIIFGFIGCIAIVIVSKWFGKVFAQRDEDYYDKR
jgi:hypothetical protein